MANDFDKFMGSYEKDHRTISKNVGLPSAKKERELDPEKNKAMMKARNAKRGRTIEASKLGRVGFRVEQGLIDKFNDIAYDRGVTFTDQWIEAMNLIIDKYSKQ